MDNSTYKPAIAVAYPNGDNTRVIYVLKDKENGSLLDVPSAVSGVEQEEVLAAQVGMWNACHAVGYELDEVVLAEEGE